MNLTLDDLLLVEQAANLYLKARFKGWERHLVPDLADTVLRRVEKADPNLRVTEQPDRTYALLAYTDRVCRSVVADYFQSGKRHHVHNEWPEEEPSGALPSPRDETASWILRLDIERAIGELPASQRGFVLRIIEAFEAGVDMPKPRHVGTARETHRRYIGKIRQHLRQRELVPNVQARRSVETGNKGYSVTQPRAVKPKPVPKPKPRRTYDATIYIYKRNEDGSRGELVREEPYTAVIANY